MVSPRAPLTCETQSAGGAERQALTDSGILSATRLRVGFVFWDGGPLEVHIPSRVKAFLPRAQTSTRRQRAFIRVCRGFESQMIRPHLSGASSRALAAGRLSDASLIAVMSRG